MTRPFPVLILIGRPASGKSEIIDYLQKMEAEERLRRFHLARLEVLDDFPMLWAWFEEDHLLSEKFRRPRLHTDEQGYFKYPYLWDLLIERLDLEIHKRWRDIGDEQEQTTFLIEFSRGSQHGGYGQAFQHLSDEVLRQAGVIYVNVPFEESLRKNRRRFNPDRPDSILEHSLPDQKLEYLYKLDDWATFSAPRTGSLQIRSVHVPYAVFENADDVTTGKPDQLGVRLEAVLDQLYARYSAGRA